MEPLRDAPSYRWHTQHVFISSTFRDFHAERDYLIKFVFPVLRAECAKWKIKLVDIDLRWGITEEEAKSFRVLDLCLKQIDKCRPFFIALLGNRYGWMPSTLAVHQANNIKEVAASFPGLEKAIEEGRSMTHLEIQHALLDPFGEQGKRMMEKGKHDPRKAFSNGFFYFRKPEDLEKPGIKAVMADEEYREFRRAFFDADAGEEQGFRSEKLAQLKKKIREHLKTLNGGDGNLYEYELNFDATSQNPEDENLKGRFKNDQLLQKLGERVLEDLRGALRTSYKERIELLTAGPSDRYELLESEREFQSSFLYEKLGAKLEDGTETDAFVGREKLLESLWGYANSSSRRILCVSGDSGSGKTMLLCKFCREYENKIGKSGSSDIVYHFTRIGGNSSGLQPILIRLCEAIKLDSGVDEEISNNVHKLAANFRDLLSNCTKNVLIIIDAIDQIDETGDAHELRWLPRELLEHVKIIVSTGVGRTLESLKGKDAEFLEMHGLDSDERRRILKEIPSVFAKTLEPALERILISRSEGESPLWIHMALEELRLFGGRGERGKLLLEEALTLPKGLEAMFTRLIERLENDHKERFRSSDSPGLVEMVFCLLECSRSGLTENEISELLPEDRERKHQPLLRQVREYLQYKGSLANFSQRAFSAAVRKKYINDEIRGKFWHKTLAKFFADKPSFIGTAVKTGARLPNIRKAHELLWQRMKSDSWAEFINDLSDLEYVESIISCNNESNANKDPYTLAIAEVRNLLTESVSTCSSSGIPGNRNLVSRIREWNFFLGQNHYVLAKKPALLFQQAYNYLDTSAPRIAAEILANANTAPPFLRIANGSLLDPALRLTFQSSVGWIEFIRLHGNQLAVASEEGRFALINPDSGEEIFTGQFEKQLGEICAMASVNESLFCIFGTNGTMIFIETNMLEPVHQVEIGVQITAADVCPLEGSTENLLIAGSDPSSRIHFWLLELAASDTLQGISGVKKGPSFQVNLNPISQIKLVEQTASVLVASRSYEMGLFSFPEGNQLFRLAPKNLFDDWQDVFRTSDVIRQDESVFRFACGMGNELSIVIFSNDSQLPLSHTKVAGFHAAIYSVTLLKDSTYAAVGSDDSTLVLVETEAPARIVYRTKANSPRVTAIAYSPSQRILFTTGGDGSIYAWDADFMALSGTIGDQFTILSPSGINYSNMGQSIRHAMACERLLFLEAIRVIASFDGHHCLFWDIQSGTVVGKFDWTNLDISDYSIVDNSFVQHQAHLGIRADGVEKWFSLSQESTSRFPPAYSSWWTIEPMAGRQGQNWVATRLVSPDKLGPGESANLVDGNQNEVSGEQRKDDCLSIRIGKNSMQVSKNGIEYQFHARSRITALLYAGNEILSVGEESGIISIIELKRQINREKSNAFF